MSKTYEEICKQKGYRISAIVIGDNRIVVEDFNEIRCPICVEKMEISGIDASSRESDNYKHIVTSHSHLDDNNTRHTYFYGNDVTQETSKVYMRCPSRCIEQMTMNVEEITIGDYRELNELRQDEIAIWKD